MSDSIEFNVSLNEPVNFNLEVGNQGPKGDKGTPVTVYYERRDYTEEQITDPALLERLNKLMEARTYDGLTNISVTGTDLTPEIKVKYMRKIN
ncbi:hypothetical protein HG471_003580 [Candidatus Saccharibacteria bacterium]|nr:hypothetical protein [Candidatus Saccharibacteria bacterium]